MIVLAYPQLTMDLLHVTAIHDNCPQRLLHLAFAIHACAVVLSPVYFDILLLVLELVLTVPNPWQAIAGVCHHVTVAVEHHRAYTFWAGIGFEAVLGVFIQPPRQRHVPYRYCDGFSVLSQ